MRIILEAKEYIARLWGKPQYTETETFRLMRYVFKQNYNDCVLLYNIVTSQLVLLDKEEVELLDKASISYVPEIGTLIDAHFLVPDQYDECKQVIGLRTVLQKYNKTQKNPGIASYTILPTTACNARCYYCFEQGVEVENMSEETANKVVDYIARNCNNKKASLLWFGGEPLVAECRIDQICKGLREKKVHFESRMITNGFLFDEPMIKKAVSDWNLVYLQISVDGTEQHYNEIKSYVNPKKNPFQKILDNVDLLLSYGIEIGLRMNFDLGNYKDFEELVSYFAKQYQNNPLLQVYAYPILGTYADREGKINHGKDEWFIGKIVELNDIARNASVLRKKKGLPFLSHVGCDADDDNAIVITPNGNLVKCCEAFGRQDAIGNVSTGIVNYDKVASWKKTVHYQKCINCIFFPKCVRLVMCKSKDRCLFMDERKKRLENTIKIEYESWLVNNT